MLTAYFDDSGTHRGSETVLMAGFWANTYQWDFLSQEWNKKLQSPSPGKLPLSRFHMAECQAGDGEFGGWGRLATDFLVRELQDIIIKSGIYGIALMLNQAHWDALVTGELRNQLGDGEDTCIKGCFAKVLIDARHFSTESEIEFIFDDRPRKLNVSNRAREIFSGLSKAAKVKPIPVSINFASSRRLPPLQAADVMAWEFYQHASDFWSGRTSATKPLRSQLNRLVKPGRIKWYFMAKREIEMFLADRSKMLVDRDFLVKRTAQAITGVQFMGRRVLRRGRFIPE